VVYVCAVAGVAGVLVVAEIPMNPNAYPNAAESPPSTERSSWVRVSTWCGVVAAGTIWVLSFVVFGYSIWEQRDESVGAYLLEHPLLLALGCAVLLGRVGLIPVAIACCLPELRSSRAAKVGLCLAIAGAILVATEEVYHQPQHFSPL
jgi:hypothetical protein